MIADRYCLHSHMAMLSPLILQISFIFYILISPLIPSIIYSLGISLNYTGVWANLSHCVDDKNMVFSLKYLQEKEFYYKIKEFSSWNFVFFTECD